MNTVSDVSVWISVMFFVLSSKVTFFRFLKYFMVIIAIKRPTITAKSVAETVIIIALSFISPELEMDGSLLSGFTAGFIALSLMCLLEFVLFCFSCRDSVVSGTVSVVTETVWTVAETPVFSVTEVIPVYGSSFACSLNGILKKS